MVYFVPQIVRSNSGDPSFCLPAIYHLTRSRLDLTFCLTTVVGILYPCIYSNWNIKQSSIIPMLNPAQRCHYAQRCSIYVSPVSQVSLYDQLFSSDRERQMSPIYVLLVSPSTNYLTATSKYICSTSTTGVPNFTPWLAIPKIFGFFYLPIGYNIKILFSFQILY